MEDINISVMAMGIQLIRFHHGANMADLKGVQLALHLDQIFNEFKTHNSIYGYSADFFFKPNSGFDFSVDVYGLPAATPMGPAAGPHTQMAQNILLSWLHGSRIIELKTIQVLDDLEIPRPCIDIRNVGFNVEWSQELSLKESLREYVTAWMLIHIIRHSELLGISRTDPFYNTIFDMSAGYDLEGITSNSVSTWLKNMQNASAIIGKLKNTIPPEFDHLKEAIVPPVVSESLTLSTFHGCPANEIEDIVTYLIIEQHLNVIVKMNPTLGGYEFTRELICDQLGYRHIELDPSAFETDLRFEQAVPMMQRLQTVAKKHKRTVGAKFTNTLVVKNTESIFNEPQRYLSGAPLYALAMKLAAKFRKAIGADFPLSFSGGINKSNFSEAVAANMVPVTTCTDLLKKGGYKKLYFYLKNLKQEMEIYRAPTIPDFISSKAGGSLPVTESGAQNNEESAQKALKNPAYHWKDNAQIPKKIDSYLKTFDCLSCNICIPVCPNAANFEYKCAPLEASLKIIRVQNGKIALRKAETFIVKKKTQIGKETLL